MQIVSQSLPFSYFIENKDEVLRNLNLKLIELKGQAYTCTDLQLPNLNNEISKIEKTIRFNLRLS